MMIVGAIRHQFIVIAAHAEEDGGVLPERRIFPDATPGFFADWVVLDEEENV